MKLTLIGHRFAGRTGEGLYDLAYQAEMPSGQTGTIIRHYMFEGRDTLNDIYLSTPNIADEVKQILASHEDRMDKWEDYFSWPKETPINEAAYEAAWPLCTAWIAGW